MSSRSDLAASSLANVLPSDSDARTGERYLDVAINRWNYTIRDVVKDIEWIEVRILSLHSSGKNSFRAP